MIIRFVLLFLSINSLLYSELANSYTSNSHNKNVLFPEDQYQSTIRLYKNSEYSDGIIESFTNLLKNDSCGCYWKSYLYLSNIYIKNGKQSKGITVLERGRNKLLAYPDSVNYIFKERIGEINRRIDILNSNPNIQYSDSLFAIEGDISDIFNSSMAPPYPCGGYSEIIKNIVYPDEARQDSIEGKVVILTYISWRGRSCRTRVVEGENLKLLVIEARKAIKKIRWKLPGNRNRIIETWYAVPIDFKIK